MISGLNKAFESRVRLGIMSLLMVHDKLAFNTMKDMLEITDGNLASHAAALEKMGFLIVKKQFVGKKPNTIYMASKSGSKAFTAHLAALEQLIRSQQ